MASHHGEETLGVNTGLLLFFYSVCCNIRWFNYTVTTDKSSSIRRFFTYLVLPLWEYRSGLCSYRYLVWSFCGYCCHIQSSLYEDITSRIWPIFTWWMPHVKKETLTLAVHLISHSLSFLMEIHVLFALCVFYFECGLRLCWHCFLLTTDTISCSPLIALSPGTCRTNRRETNRAKPNITL